MQNLAHRWTMTREVLSGDSATVAMSGGNDARRAYETYSGAHPRLRVVPYKRWGVALLPVPESEAAYLGGGSRQLLRNKRSRALRDGYSFRPFAAGERFEEIMEIHLSAPERQGQAILSSYTNEESVRRFSRSAGELWGVFDGGDRLRAYAHVPVYGDVGIFTRLLGHADHLLAGTMYLLVSECVLALARQREESGRPAWAMYDTFWGAKPGMAYFKRRLGFAPHRVEWVWAGDD